MALYLNDDLVSGTWLVRFASDPLGLEPISNEMQLLEEGMIRYVIQWYFMMLSRLLFIKDSKTPVT